MSHSVLRRYTPPTCTLEIRAANSPLSRWAGQPVLKHLQFQLSLDDPKLLQEQWVTLRGDRAQLEALSEVVGAYVQQSLQPNSRVSSPVAVGGDSAIAVLPAPSPQLVGLRVAPAHHGITLQPKGLVSHELTLGSLATEETGSSVRLSALQLFDLANALDEYATDVVALPNLQKSGWLKAAPAWKQIAAIALVMVGLSASLVKLLEPGQQAATVATSSEGASSSDQRIATQLPPTATETPIPGSSTLPPPPPLGSTVPPSPGLPTVTLPQTAPTVPDAPAQPSGTIAAKPAPPASSSNQITAIPEGAGENQVRATQPSQPTAKLPPDAAMRGVDSLSQQPSMAAQPEATRSTGEQADQATTAFDTIPQVAEVRRYFEQRWTPPQGLTQTLEYSLSVGSDGTIQQISPLGQAAGDYVDRTGIPLVGEPFVSAIESGRSAKIRLVLSPDGQVRTLLEKLD